MPDVPQLPFLSQRDFSSTRRVSYVPAQVKSSWSNPKTIQVTAVTDGDGLQGSYADGSGAVICRITGIDAPETAKSFRRDAQGRSDPGQRYGAFGAQTLERLIKDKKVEVQVSLLPEDKKYGRDLCLVTINGDNLSNAMVEAGAAYVYQWYVKPELTDALNASEQNARRRRVGVWENPQEERPWDYRNRTRGTYTTEP